MNRKRASSLLVVGFLAGGCAVCYLWEKNGLTPTETGQPLYFHLSHSEKVGVVFHQLHDLGVVRNAAAFQIYGYVKRFSVSVRGGTYLLNPGMTADEIFYELGSPMHKNFRFPETNWARRNANLLQRANVTTAKEYLSLVKNPSEFAGDYSFPLPATTLEGYLYPDTYDLPPLTGAHAVVSRQLKAFQTKVVDKLGPVAASDTIIRKASLVELETGTDQDRAMIAGVIENRLKKGMPLQIDAGIEYALGKWRRLYFKDYTGVKSPYNLYLHKGLPPTPICSPSFKSIVAVLHPAKHEYLYYVAMPDGHSIYAKTPAQHEHNIRLRKIALAEREKRRAMLGEFLKPTGGTADSSKGKP